MHEVKLIYDRLDQFSLLVVIGTRSTLEPGDLDLVNQISSMCEESHVFLSLSHSSLGSTAAHVTNLLGGFGGGGGGGESVRGVGGFNEFLL